jgi:HlyD family secretion protein
VRSALGVDERRVSVIGDIHARRPAGPRYEVRAVVLSRREGVLVVPSGALVRDGAAWSVFVVGEKGRVHATPVTLIARGAESAAVEGLAEGARVIVFPPEALTEGARVTW